MRILNPDALNSHGNIAGRRVILEILEAGMQAADPYANACKLIRVEGNRLIVGNRDFEPVGDPRSGDEVFDLDKVGRIFVVGAGKGMQYAAKAFEDILGDRLTGGHIVAKHGDEHLLSRIGVTYGAHPVPDEGCAEGCRRILEICDGLQPEDLVFTIIGNGVSSLLTLPVPGIPMADVSRMTYQMQIERGVPTGDLNMIRNHIDLMKSGRISRHILPATAVHIVCVDPSSYDQLMYRNLWLHTLPDCTTFADAIKALHKWDAADVVPESIRSFLLRADPEHETVKADGFADMRFRMFGIMPSKLGPLPVARAKAAELGFTPHTLAGFLSAEAREAGYTIAAIALSCERMGTPFEPPCALFTTGELLVTVGDEDGIGGRNQEYTLAAAFKIAGSKHVVFGAIDTDGTDGPGSQFSPDGGTIPCLAGGVTDGQTLAEAKTAGIDLYSELKRHNTSPALWKLGSGINATHNISIGDLGVVLVTGRSSRKE
jgi:glycerate 2-kinase